MGKWADEYEAMVNDCEKRESQLSEWEANFIESLSDWVDNGRSITPKQAETLNRIWERVTKNG